MVLTELENTTSAFRYLKWLYHDIVEPPFCATVKRRTRGLEAQAEADMLIHKAIQEGPFIGPIDEYSKEMLYAHFEFSEEICETKKRRI